jgi:hypothetical protein
MGKTVTSTVLNRERPEKTGTGMEFEETIKISRLYNSIYYFIELVYIAKQQDSYRLIALHRGRILYDRLYRDLRGAKIGFAKRFKRKKWDRRAKPVWSPMYTPDRGWCRRNAPAANPKNPNRRGEP